MLSTASSLLIGRSLFSQYRAESTLIATRPTAIILGNEHRGMDPDVKAHVPDEIFIPMFGMVQSLNVSVAAAVILYEAMRQRRAAGMYGQSSLDDEGFEAIYADWCKRGKDY